MSAAVTAEATASKLATELRALADRVERATSWAALRESLDALTPTLRSTRGRVVRHTRAPKAAPAERPAPKAEAAKPAVPTPVKAEPKQAPAAPAPKAPQPATVAAPAPRRPARCPGTLTLIAAATVCALWFAAGESTRAAGRRLWWHWRKASRPVVWAIQDLADWVGWARDRLAARAAATITRVTSTLRRRP